jgi:hypothetical protein
MTTTTLRPHVLTPYERLLEGERDRLQAEVSVLRKDVLNGLRRYERLLRQMDSTELERTIPIDGY